MTRGQRVVQLRRSLRLSQQSLARLAGFSRPQISNVENNNAKWASDRLWRGLGVATGLTRQQLEDYVDGRVSLDVALEIAKPRVEMLMARERESRRHEKSAREIAREAMTLAGLRRDVFADVLVCFLECMVQRYGRPEPPAMVDSVRALRVAVEKWLDGPTKGSS